MMTSATPEMNLSTWQGTAVDIGSIEAALCGLWHTSEGQPAGTGRPARTSVMNLVIYVPRLDHEAQRVMAAVGGLVERHPSRTILVIADPGAATPSLDAQVSAQCGDTLLAGQRLCWEQIAVTAHGPAAAHAPSIVTPLLLPDLPIYLWWSGEPPFDTDLYQRMRALCDWLIVESSRFARPLAGLAALETATRSRSGDRGTSDFAWVALTAWRDLVAQFFDLAAAQPYAVQLERVEIGYAAGSGGVPDPMGAPGLSPAVLFAGWLAARLGWTARPGEARTESATLHLQAERPDGHAVAIEISPRPGGTVGYLASVRLVGMLRDVQATFTVEHDSGAESATTTATISEMSPVVRAARMAECSLSDLLATELDIYRHDTAYESALQAGAALCGPLTNL